MFTLRKEETFEWPVEVRMPSASRPGQHETHKFFATFRALPPDEMAELVARMSAAAAEGSDEEARALAERLVVDWRDVVGEDGRPIAFSIDALVQAMRLPMVRLALFAAYSAAVSPQGVQARRRGN